MDLTGAGGVVVMARPWIELALTPMLVAMYALSAVPYPLSAVGDAIVSTTFTVTLPDPVGAAVGDRVCVGAWVGLFVCVQALEPGRANAP